VVRLKNNATLCLKKNNLDSFTDKLDAEYIKANGFTYLSLKMKNNRIRRITSEQEFQVMQPSLSQEKPVLTLTAVEISVHSRPFYSEVIYVWYINVSTSHLYFLHFSCAES
jgi:hypothetical protein